jgi:integrase
MSRTEKRLSARTAAAATLPGRYMDGGGLFLDVEPGGRRRWIYRYRLNGRRRDMGLGSPDHVSLAEARAERDRWRKEARQGRDPIEARKRERKGGDAMTFGQAADSFIASHEASWRNDKHVAQWKMTLSTYAAPLRERRIAEISTADVLAVLKPIWREKAETATRLRGRIEQVIDAARALGHIPADQSNPARWKGHLDKLLPARERLSRGNHAAMAYADVPAFCASLRGEDTVSARALEFCILTAARTGEVIGARREEIDIETRLWIVPAQRMKAAKEHRVPLCDRAVEIARETMAASESLYVFPGRRPQRPMSNMAFDMLLRRRALDVTTHGFRSAFRDWAGDETHFPREVAEAALAHAVGDETERAYRRGDALAKRRELMEAWARFLAGADGGAAVISLSERRKAP